MNILSDLMYVWIDPRIDFENDGRREAMVIVLRPTQAPYTAPRCGAPHTPDAEPGPSREDRRCRPRGAVLVAAIYVFQFLNRRRWQNFTANRRAFWSLCIFALLYGLSLFAELLANDRPILVQYRGEYFTPIFQLLPPRPRSAAISAPRRSTATSRCNA